MTTIKEAKEEFAKEYLDIIKQLEDLCNKHGLVFLDSTGVDYGYLPSKIQISDYWDSSRCY